MPRRGPAPSPFSAHRRLEQLIGRLDLEELEDLDWWIHSRIEELKTPPPATVDAEKVVEEKRTARGCLRRELVQCGKQCRGCRKGHGPYWYLYAWCRGRVRKTYVGKTLKQKEHADA